MGSKTPLTPRTPLTRHPLRRAGRNRGPGRRPRRVPDGRGRAPALRWVGVLAALTATLALTAPLASAAEPVRSAERVPSTEPVPPVDTLTVTGSDHTPPDRPSGPRYYLSLGDSLAAGYQPDVGEDTDVAYTDQLYARLKQSDPGLRHLRLGCSGETTATLIHGGRCAYPTDASQLTAALRALREHRGRITHVTLTIGANDLNACTSDSGVIDRTCLAGALRTVRANLTLITAALRWTGGADVAYAGMTYYNPTLATWLLGPEGERTARDSAAPVRTGNRALAGVYARAGFRVADVAGAFRSEDFSTRVELPGVGRVPVNVARICRWTWQCSLADGHANPEGHRVIADAFASVLRPRDPHGDPGRRR